MTSAPNEKHISLGIWLFLLLTVTLGATLTLSKAHEMVRWSNAPLDPTRTLYLRLGYCNVAILLALGIGTKQILEILQPFCRWLTFPTHRRARITISAAMAIVLFSFFTRAHFGFWFGCIGGWTYEHMNSPIIFDQETSPPNPAVPTFLREGLNTQAVSWLRLQQAGKLWGNLSFLHFKDGTVKPFNEGLFELVFAHYVFGNDNHLGRPDPNVLRNAIRLKYAQLHRKGFGFLLPEAIAYPNHMVYTPIDYRTYPAPELLEKTSTWNVVVAITPDAQINIVHATLLNEVML